MYKLAISVAHHEGAKGATFNDLNEYDLSKLISAIVFDYTRLYFNDEESGFTAEMVPVGKLKDKVAYINENNFDAAIEIHFNACGNCGASGHEVLYYPKSTEGQLLALSINKFLKQLDKKDRGVKEGWYRMDQPNIVDYDGDVEGDETINYFLEKTNCPAVIIEPQFIEKMDKNLTKYVEDSWCIINGVGNYFRNK